MNISIQFGTQVMSKHFSETPTVSQVINSASVKAELGYGDNVKGIVNGVEQADNALVGDGSTLLIEAKANSKATRLVALIVALFKS